MFIKIHFIECITFLKGDNISLEKIVETLEKTKEETIKHIPVETITKTIRILGDSVKGVYPEYYIILNSSIESFKLYKENAFNLLNNYKDHIYNLYKLFFG